MDMHSIASHFVSPLLDVPLMAREPVSPLQCWGCCTKGRGWGIFGSTRFADMVLGYPSNSAVVRI